jgi:hypothetical protein
LLDFSGKLAQNLRTDDLVRQRQLPWAALPERIISPNGPVRLGGSNGKRQGVRTQIEASKSRFWIQERTLILVIFAIFAILVHRKMI